MTNQKPDKCGLCGEKLMPLGEWELLGGICPNWNSHKPEFPKEEPIKWAAPDTTLREEIRDILEKAGVTNRKHMTEKDRATQSILDLLANRLPLYKYTVEAPRTKLKEAEDTGYNQALSEVRAIIEGEK